MKVFGFWAISLLFLFSASITRSSPLKLIQTIPLPNVEGRIDHLTVDEAGERLFVAALGNNTVEVINLKTSEQFHSITGLSEPQGVVFVPEENRLFVSNGGNGSVSVFEGNSFASDAKLDFEDDADNLRYQAQSGQVYVGFGSGAIGIIDARGLKQVGEIKLSGHPEAFELEKNGDRVFVNVPTAKEVAVVDGKKKAVLAGWPVKGAQANFPMALDEAHHRLFVGCRQPAELILFDTQSGKEIERLAIDGDADDIFYDAARNRIYVVCGAGFIDIFQQVDVDRYKPTGKIPTASGARTGLFAPGENRLYLAVPHRSKQPAEIRVYEVQN